MSATTQTQKPTASIILALTILGLLSLAALSLATPIGTVSEHALEKHPDAMIVTQRARNERWLCHREYRSLPKNRVLHRFSYENLELEGGIFTTVSGKYITHRLMPSPRWDQVIIRDGMQLVEVEGQCVREEN